MNILFLSRWFPYPANNGSKLRIYNLLRELAEHHNVTLLSFADEPDVNPEAPEIRTICHEVHTVPWREFDPNSFRALSGFFNLKPRSVVDTFSAEMAGKITQLLTERKFDLVLASQVSMAAYRPYYRNLPAVFEEVEIGLSVGEVNGSRELTKRLRHALTWFKFRTYLGQLLDTFQACTVVSEQERNLLSRNFADYKDIVEIIPNCVRVDEYDNLQPTLQLNQLIFTGSFRFHANYEAMLWFVREVYPLILKQVPDVHLVITGDNANLQFPDMPGINCVGYVDDVKPLIASSWISIAPLLSGGGTRLKILEAMAAGTPVVSTSKGVEGLNGIAGEHFLVADSPVDFADQVVRLLKSTLLRNKLSIRGKQFVKQYYSWETVTPRLLRLVENTLR